MSLAGPYDSYIRILHQRFLASLMRLEKPPLLFFFLLVFPSVANFFTLTNLESSSSLELRSESEPELELELDSELVSDSLTIALIFGFAMLALVVLLVVSFTSGTPRLARSVREFNRRRDELVDLLPVAFFCLPSSSEEDLENGLSVGRVVTLALS